MSWADTNALFSVNAKWYHVSLVRNLTTQKLDLYVDSTWKLGISMPNTFVISDAPLNIGVSMHNWTEGMRAWMSDFIFVKDMQFTTPIYD
jgi:hypothetical protein